MPRLEAYAKGLLKSDPVRLSAKQAEALLGQFQETSAYRNWQLLAASIMSNHVHIVVGVLGDPAPSKILGDFKSYGSRLLNRSWKRPGNPSWWAESGSKRKLPRSDAVFAAVNYVKDQEYPLLTWTAPIPELDLAGGRIV